MTLQFKPIGLAIVAASLIVPMIWLPPLAAKFDSVALFSQYLGMAALIAMSLGQIIATRLGFVERIFGGLDRSYILHKWLGIGSMIAILLHDTIDAEMDGLGRETLLTEFAETAGEISLYGFLILVVITITTFIPYHLWRWTHKIIGGFFVLSALHYWLILKPFSNGDPIGIFVSVFCALGILAYVYKILPRSMHPTKAYEIKDIKLEGLATAITMTPTKRALKHRAGQFAFATFDGIGMNEPHPFTISKAPDASGDLRMTVASLGDFTNALASRVKLGGKVKIEGPFGRFERKRGLAAELWIAAGVGITPFVAWAQSLTDKDGLVTLFYCVRDAKDAAHLTELQRIEGRLKNFRVIVHDSQIQSRLNADQIVNQMGFEATNAQAYFCGPEAMRKSLAKGLAIKGIPQRKFHFEEFEIRSGIGLRALARLLLKRLQ